MAGDILSIPEAAAILGVSRIAVFKRVKSGAIPAFRVGRSWAIAREDLPAAAGRQTAPPTPRRANTAHGPAKKPQPIPSPPAATAPSEEPEELDSMGWD